MRDLTEEEVKIYERSKESNLQEKKHLEYGIKHFSLQLEEGHQDEFFQKQKATKVLLEDYKEKLKEINFVLDDIESKLKNGVD